jgi:2,5-diamino-6-(ribosylamino)-4(3H)-pyrimidinone 5'-phosphate reductase
MSPNPKFRDALYFDIDKRPAFEPFLPTVQTCPADRAWCTLTYASSLDSQISLAPGTQTPLSGPESKAMTHFLRSRHDAILIGVGTVLADDPSLNCRLEGVGGYGGAGLDKQPVPIVIDPRGRWKFAESKVYRLAKEGKGRAPFVFTSAAPTGDSTLKELCSLGGGVVYIQTDDRMDWLDVLQTLKYLKLNSTMIEGGGSVINSLLDATNQEHIDSVIVTIAPTWLGQGGVVVSPERRTENGRPIPAARLRETAFCPLGEDVVLCGKMTSKSPSSERVDDSDGFTVRQKVTIFHKAYSETGKAEELLLTKLQKRSSKT